MELRHYSKATHSLFYSVSVVVDVIMSDSLQCVRPPMILSGLLRVAEAASCFAACDLRPSWLSPPRCTGSLAPPVWPPYPPEPWQLQ